RRRRCCAPPVGSGSGVGGAASSGGALTALSIGSAPVAAGSLRVAFRDTGAARFACCYHRHARTQAAFSRYTDRRPMPNIKQQKKRVRITGRQRDENIRYRSTVKKMTKRRHAAVETGDADAIAAEHRTLVRWVDRAASKGALHANTAARKKAQAARLVARGSGSSFALPARPPPHRG